jgi:hypothetical protein
LSSVEMSDVENIKVSLGNVQIYIVEPSVTKMWIYATLSYLENTLRPDKK